MSLPALSTQSPRRRERREVDAPLPRAQLGKLRRWIAHSAAAVARAVPALPDVFESLNIAPPRRRETDRRPATAGVLVRRIGACSLGGIERGELHDVSENGLALVLREPAEPATRLHVEVEPPADLPRGWFRRGDGPVSLLVVVRHCRPIPAGFVVGCGAGVDLADSLADAMLPADLPVRRRSA